MNLKQICECGNKMLIIYDREDELVVRGFFCPWCGKWRKNDMRSVLA